MTERDVNVIPSPEVLNQARVSALIYYPLKSGAGIPIEKTAEVVRTGLKHDRIFMLVDENGKLISQRENPKVSLINTDCSFGGPEAYPSSVVFSCPGARLDILHLPTFKGEIFTAKLHRDEVQVVDQGERINKWFSDFLGTKVALVVKSPDFTRGLDPIFSDQGEVLFADGYPFLIASDESISDLNSRMTTELPMDRFRPNIVLSGTGIPYAEDYMQKFRIGDVEFEVVKPCSRCVITTTDQKTGERTSKDETGTEPLKTLRSYRRGIDYAGRKGVFFAQNAVNLNTGSISVGDQVQVLEFSDSPNFQIAD